MCVCVLLSSIIFWCSNCSSLCSVCVCWLVRVRLAWRYTPGNKIVTTTYGWRHWQLVGLFFCRTTHFSSVQPVKMKKKKPYILQKCAERASAHFRILPHNWFQNQNKLCFIFGNFELWLPSDILSLHSVTPLLCNWKTFVRNTFPYGIHR